MTYTSNTRHQLLQLSYIRTITIFGQGALLLYSFFILNAELNQWLTTSTLLAMALLNFMTLIRLQSSVPATPLELFIQLIADILLYSLLLYQVGGSNNPFSSLLLMPLILSATTLNRHFTWAIALLACLCYSLLLKYNIPITLPNTGHKHQADALMNLHMTGMWINFLIIAALITYFVVNISQHLKQQEHVLIKAREQRLRDQQLLSLATMAAGTAHEMGTPLATMRVLLHEMSLDHRDDPELNDDIQILQSQVENCSERLKQLANSVKEEHEQARLLPAETFLNELLNRWQILRPDARFEAPRLSGETATQILSSIPLQQAFINLLNNAADACQEPLTITLDYIGHNIIVKIHDQGPGIPLEKAEDIGKPFITTKGKGLGIGLFLTASALTSYGGEVRLYNHPEGGTLTEVTLPAATVKDD